MNNIKNLVLAYCSPLRKNHPNLRELESKLQPAGTPTPTRRMWLRIFLGLVLVSLAILSIRKGVPFISERVPNALYGLPFEIQLLAIAAVGAPLSIGIGFGIYLVFRRFAERRALEMHIQKIRDLRKLMVYVYGSGALGFTRALERLSKGNLFDNLTVWSHPPASSQGRGSVRNKGAVTATAPVQHAMNSAKSAVSARGEESMDYAEAHQKFLMDTGAIKTDVEWSVLHLGQGHTSLSCHAAWERDRTTALVGAQPGRYFIVVKDAKSSDDTDTEVPDNEWSLPNAISDSSANPFAAGPTVVEVSNEYETGSGVVADQDGLILTSADLISEQKDVRITLPSGLTTNGTILLRDEESDIALVRCQSIPENVSFSKGDSSDLVNGDFVTIFGPSSSITGNSIDQKLHGGVSKIVSDPPYTIIKTNLPNNPNLRGAPLVNERGEFVGLISDIFLDSPDPGMVAISSNDIFDVLDFHRPAQFSTLAAD